MTAVNIDEPCAEDDCGEDFPALEPRARPGAQLAPCRWRTASLVTAAAVASAAGYLSARSCGWRWPSRPFLGNESVEGPLPLVGLSVSKSGDVADRVVCTMDVAQMASRVIQMSNAIDQSTRNCDYDRIRRVTGRSPTSRDKELCTSSILIAVFNAHLLAGLLTSSVSMCTGNLNVPANCATNIAAFVGAVPIILQGALDVDISCAKGFSADFDLEAKLEAKRAELQREKAQAVRHAQQALKNAGLPVQSQLPPPPAVPSNTVYAAVSRCVSFLNLGTTQVIRLALVLIDTSEDCRPEVGSRQPRVCAIDIMSTLLGLSISMRAFSLASIACVQVVGDFNPTAACVQACAGLSAGAFAFTARAMNVAPACSTAFQSWDPDAWERARLAQKHPSKLEVPAEEGNIIIPEA